jgi:mannose/fructose/N-acetylgalactosamine-specific phosphotransferase system component IID
MGWTGMNETNNRDNEVRHLSLSLLVRTVFRTLFVQAGWNYDNFQGIGFAYALVPFARKLGFRAEELGSLVRRHLSCFNTNPYLSGMVVGEVLRLEARYREGLVSQEEIESIKKELMGALGALGDSLIWGALRPMAGLAAVLVALVAETPAPLVFLVLFNAVCLWIRIAGVHNGYAYGPDLLKYLKRIDLQRKIRVMNGIILFSVGALVPLWVIQAAPGTTMTHMVLLGFIVVLIWAFWKAERKEVPLMAQVTVLFVLAQVMVHMGWISL